MSFYRPVGGRNRCGLVVIKSSTSWQPTLHPFCTLLGVGEVGWSIAFGGKCIIHDRGDRSTPSEPWLRQRRITEDVALRLPAPLSSIQRRVIYLRRPVGYLQYMRWQLARSGWEIGLWNSSWQHDPRFVTKIRTEIYLRSNLKRSSSIWNEFEKI